MTPIGTLARISRAAVFSLGRELAAWKPSGERAMFGLEAMLSVALAVALSHALHLSNTWWAAISGYAVIQTSFAGSVQRAAYRIVGTLIGAALATLIGPWIGDRPWVFIPALGLIGGVAVYYANGSNATYAWILGGITALLVTFEAHQLLSVSATASFALLRVAEVAIGTLACLVVAGVFHFAPKWYARLRSSTLSPLSSLSSSASPGGVANEFWPSAAADSSVSAESMHLARLLLSVQGALSIAILAALTYVLHLSGFAQAMVTALAVLVVPAASLADRTGEPVVEKMVQRLGGCLLAGLLGVALLPVTQGQAVLCMLVLSMGVWIGCHVQTGQEGASYVGRQFTIAFIMVFVQDHQWSADPVPALQRLSGILIGIVVLTVVMLGTSGLFARADKTNPQ